MIHLAGPTPGGSLHPYLLLTLSKAGLAESYGAGGRAAFYSGIHSKLAAFQVTW